MIQVFLSTGSNLGDSVGYLRQAYDLLSPYFQDFKSSSIVLSEPMYVLDQPKFYNQVLGGKTRLSLQKLFQTTQNVQEKIGRIKTYRNGPRSIDIDILYYGNSIYDDGNLLIPHPRISERLFVLQPLAELAPNWVCPQTHKTIMQLLQECYERQNLPHPLSIIDPEP